MSWDDMALNSFEKSLEREELLDRLKEKHNCSIWMTANGDLVPVKLMSDRHLINAWRMLVCKSVSISEATAMYCHPIFGPSPGSMAELAADAEMDEAWDRQYRLGIWIEILENEMKRREIDIPIKPKARRPPEIESIENVGTGLIIKLKKGE